MYSKIKFQYLEINCEIGKFSPLKGILCLSLKSLSGYFNYKVKVKCSITLIL